MVVLFNSCPTLEQIDQAMAPFRYGRHHEELAWDYFKIQEWGTVDPDLRDDWEWFGQIIEGEFGRFNHEQVHGRGEDFYMLMDVHE